MTIVGLNPLGQLGGLYRDQKRGPSAYMYSPFVGFYASPSAAEVDIFGQVFDYRVRAQLPKRLGIGCDACDE